MDHSPGAQEMLSFNISAPSVAVGNSVSATIRLNTVATTLTLIDLSASSEAVSLPSSVVIDRGASAVTFTIYAGNVPSATPIKITASLPPNTQSAQSATLAVLARVPGDDASGIVRLRSDGREITATLEARRAPRPLPPSIAVFPSILGPAEGQPRLAFGRLTLPNPAPPGGVSFRLVSSTAGVSAPVRVEIQPGQTSAIFSLSVDPAANEATTITAFPSGAAPPSPLVATLRFVRSPFATATDRRENAQYTGSLRFDEIDLPVRVTRDWRAGTIQIAIQSLNAATDSAFSLTSAPVALTDPDGATLEFSKLSPLGFIQQFAAPEFFAAGVVRLHLDADNGTLTGTLDLRTETRTIRATLTARKAVPLAGLRLSVTQEVIALPVKEGPLTFGQIELPSPAPAGGLIVALGSSAPEITVPAEVRFPPNALRLDFPISLTGNPRDAILTATAGTDVATSQIRFSKSSFAIPQFQTRESHQGTLTIDGQNMRFYLTRHWDGHGAVSVELSAGAGTTGSSLEVALLPEPLSDLDANAIELRRFQALGFVQLGGGPGFVVSGSLALTLLDEGRSMRGELRLRTSTRLYTIALESDAPSPEPVTPESLPLLSLSPSVIPSGSPDPREGYGSIRLASPAPSAGAIFRLSSDSPDVIVPETVRVPPGASLYTFSYTILPSANQTVAITASGEGQTHTVPLRFSGSLFAGLSANDTYVGTLTLEDGQAIPLTFSPAWYDDGSVGLDLMAGDENVQASFSLIPWMAPLPDLNSNTITFTQFPPLTHFQADGPPIFIESAELSITLR